MENENGNRYGTGEGQGPDYHTGNREPVIVAEQPAREVTEEDSGQTSAGQDGSDGWSSPVDAPLQEDRWSETGDKPYLGSPWEPTPSGASYDAGKENGVSGNDSQPVYKPAPASYGQGQPGANQGQPGINQGQPGSARAAISAKMTATGKEEAVSRAETANISPNTRPSIRPSTSLSSLRIRKRTIWPRLLWLWEFFPCAVSAAACCSVSCSACWASYLPLCTKKRRENGQPGKGRTDTLYYRCCRHCAYYHSFFV